MREVVNFELGKEIKKDVLSPCHERGTSVVHRAVVRHINLIHFGIWLNVGPSSRYKGHEGGRGWET